MELIEKALAPPYGSDHYVANKHLKSIKNLRKMKK